MTKLFAAFFLCLVAFIEVKSQEIQVSSIENDEGVVSMIASISPKESERERYDLFIYSSADNFLHPIDFQLTDLAPNQDHRITFDGGEQIGSYKGDLRFRFEIEASRFPLYLIDPKSKYRRGKPIALRWDDYHQVGPYQVELWKDDQLQEILARDLQTPNLDLVLSKNLDKGKNYQIKVKALAKDGLDSESYPIAIQGKYGLAVKVLPVLAVGGAVPFILTSGGDGGSGDLANPPGPPIGN